jgi:hypothetical protein
VLNVLPINGFYLLRSREQKSRLAIAQKKRKEEGRKEEKKKKRRKEKDDDEGS